MINAHTGIRPTVELALLLLCWVFILWSHGRRGRVGNVIILDMAPVVVLAIGLRKTLINSPAESERQRRRSDQLLLQ